MYKITFITFLMATALTFGQSLPYDYENGTLTATFQFGGLTYSNIANPDSNGNPSSRVLQVAKPAGSEWFGGFGYGEPAGAIIANMANGTAFSLNVWSTKANLPIRFELQRPGEVSYNVIQTVATANSWVELTFDFSSQVNGTENYSVIVIQPDYNSACEGGGCPQIAVGGTYYFDNITQIGAPEPTCTDGIQNGNETGVDCGGPDCPTCPETCNDGIQNQDETGVDCGGVCPNACPAADPTTGPVNNGSTGTDFYIYSELSGNPNSSDFAAFNLVDFAGGTQISQPVLSGDTVLRATNLDFFGSGLGGNFNATGSFDFVHLNYYATTSTAFNFSLVDDSLSATICCGNPQEPFYRFGAGGDAPLVTGQWVSVFIPLSHFANFPDLVSGTWDGTDIKQTLFTGNGTVYFDNIFFSTSNTLSNDDFSINNFKVHPNPSQTEWTVNAANDVIKSIQLFDILGKQVLSILPNTSVAKIDASQLTKGLYFANIVSENGSSTIKLIKN